MEVITIESQVFKALTASIDAIAKFVATIECKQAEQLEDGWVDSHDVCNFLKISSRTLQRLRATKMLSFSKIRGKNFYRISEIRRLMNENIIRRKDELLQNLINNQQLHVKKG